MSYAKFLESKSRVDRPSGFEPESLSPSLFPFQRDIVRWACVRGRAAIFADCGLGKSLMQLEWCRQVIAKVGGRALILAPLSVANQTVEEAEKFGITAKRVRSTSDVVDGINVTNYEMLHAFDAEDFSAIVLDESSILKSYDSKTRNHIIESFRATPYKLACTATPAPNDYVELGNHAEFLGAMTRVEMLSMFFVHDGGETQAWRLKGHARSKFWKWVSSWGCMIRKPSDLGYADDGYVLPKLDIIEHVVQIAPQQIGMLFDCGRATLTDRRAARRASLDGRVSIAANLCADDDQQWILWCDLNAESEALAASIDGAVEVRGSQTAEEKDALLSDFAHGRIRVLVSKPSIAGFGMNFQRCRRMAFVGLSDSYESMYQAIRRSWRFGQARPVDVHVITSSAETAVRQNIERKQADSEAMAKEMAENMESIKLASGGTERRVDTYAERDVTGNGWKMMLGDSCERMKEIADGSVAFSIFSPPFASLYTYSASDRDIGNCGDLEEFSKHFEFIVAELFRVTMTGRLVSFHCMNLPTSKVRDGVIGIRDFRGELIRTFEAAGFVFHSEVCIWKDPVTSMQRTKALGLLHKQLKKDSCMSRQAIPDYLVTMRKPGENAERVTNTNESFPVREWQNYASPVWMDINPNETLQHQSAREEEDERHICPLQLEVIRRALRLWSKPGDVVFSPFAGIGSEGHVAIEGDRKFVGIELKQSYFDQACRNLAATVIKSKQSQLFSASST